MRKRGEFTFRQINILNGFHGPHSHIKIEPGYDRDLLERLKLIEPSPIEEGFWAITDAGLKAGDD